MHIDTEKQFRSAIADELADVSEQNMRKLTITVSRSLFQNEAVITNCLEASDFTLMAEYESLDRWLEVIMSAKEELGISTLQTV
jgi:hypothetical protein